MRERRVAKISFARHARWYDARTHGDHVAALHASRRGGSGDRLDFGLGALGGAGLETGSAGFGTEVAGGAGAGAAELGFVPVVLVVVGAGLTGGSLAVGAGTVGRTAAALAGVADVVCVFLASSSCFCSDLS